MAKDKSVKKLEDLPGIGETSAEKLKAAGIDTLEKVATSQPHDLSEKSGISVEAAKKAIQAAQEATTIEFETGTNIAEKGRHSER